MAPKAWNSGPNFVQVRPNLVSVAHVDDHLVGKHDVAVFNQHTRGVGEDIVDVSVFQAVGL